MNIFYLSTDIRNCAKYHCDKHCVKMIVEQFQLLSTAARLLDPHHKDDLYKITHKNHPCAIWARSTRANYIWLMEMTRELCLEYTNRYGKIHSSERLFPSVERSQFAIPYGEFTEPPKCMPDDVKVDSVVQSYRNYYNKHKSQFAVWKYTEIPHWYKGE